MTADEIRDRYPEAARRIAAEARREERERIRRIEEVARPGCEDLIRRAKYEDPSMTAEDVSRRIVERDRRIRRSAAGEARSDTNEEQRR